MGAWGYAVFDDDTAYDALTDLKASANIAADMEKYFDTAIQAKYVNFDDGIYALAAAAVLDSVMNGTPYRCDEEDYLAWTVSLKAQDLAPLRQKAVQAIGAVLSDHSESKELWEENQALYGLWREDKRSMQGRLG